MHCWLRGSAKLCLMRGGYMHWPTNSFDPNSSLRSLVPEGEQTDMAPNGDARIETTEFLARMRERSCAYLPSET